MKVLFQYQGLITDQYKAFYRTNLPEDIELIFPSKGDTSKLLEHAPETDIFVGYSVTEEFLTKASKLKHLQIPWTGFNSLDAKLLENRPEITVSNSHSNSLAIAEHAVALLFAAAKLLPHRDSTMRKGDWSTRGNETNSMWITGKKFGIIGYGAIGKKVAKMLKHGFNMEILAIKRTPGEKDEFCDFVGGIGDLEHVIRESDFILIAVPQTDETNGLIGKEQISWMKEDVVLVNIARGEIVDEESLYLALKEKRIGAAGIDVWYNYPKSGEIKIQQNYPFEELDNIVMTPHSAFKVRDRVEIFAQDILQNIQLIYEGKTPINQVYLDLGY
ncbi:MAG: NAD(P)-binding domain-containing protein [Candidatus Heimdallarchaeota archaeon]|nr:NAD(P)-binding domain-containing protein [Candidatus Heimdallarchaeota archaeon]